MKAKTQQILGILVIGIPLFFLSCKKDREVAKYEGDYMITGKVIDQITGKGISQANVGVIERDRDATSHLGGKTVAFDKSDAEGNFSLTFSANSKENNYELTANALNYFEKNGGGDIITFTKNGNKSQNISLIPTGFLKYIIKGNKGGSSMYINYENAGGPYYKNVDTFRMTYKLPLHNEIVGYNVYDNSKTLMYRIQDTVYINRHDTTYYLIEF